MNLLKRQMPLLIKYKEARTEVRAFFFDLEVSFVASEVDPQTGFALSLVQVDKVLTEVPRHFERAPVGASQNLSRAQSFMNAVQRILLQVSTSEGLSVQDFSLVSMDQRDQWACQSPWSLDLMRKKSMRTLRDSDEEFILSLEISLNEASLESEFFETVAREYQQLSMCGVEALVNLSLAEATRCFVGPISISAHVPQKNWTLQKSQGLFV